MISFINTLKLIFIIKKKDKLNFNPYDFEKNTLAGMQRRNNQGLKSRFKTT